VLPKECAAVQKANFKKICNRLSKHSVSAENTADTVNTASKQSAQLYQIKTNTDIDVIAFWDTMSP